MNSAGMDIALGYAASGSCDLTVMCYKFTDFTVNALPRDA